MAVGSLLVVALLLTNVPAGGARATSVSSRGASATDLLDGLVTMQTTQTVNGTGYWIPFCPAATTVNCIVPVGVTYVPSTGVLLVVQQAAYIGSPGARTQNAFQEVNPTDLSYGPLQNLTCVPRAPFYPGSGPDVYVPCFLNSTVFVINTETDTIAATVSTPYPFCTLAFDPRDGLIYAGSASGALASLNPSTDAVTQVANVTGAAFLQEQDFGVGTQLVYDAVTSQLIAFSETGGLVAIDPATGAGRPLRPLSLQPTALGVDPSNGELFVSAIDPATVQVYSSTTDALLANYSMPLCVDNICGDSNVVTSFVMDPTHGDMYFVSGLAVLAVNLSSLSIVGTIFASGESFAGSATYLPADDRMFGTFQLEGSPGPGFLVEMTHGNTTLLAGLLWLPVAPGILVVGGGVGLAAAAWSAARRPRPMAQLPAEQPGGD